jgi:Zn-dependent M16 (insulinase) family peptidase
MKLGTSSVDNEKLFQVIEKQAINFNMYFLNQSLIIECTSLDSYVNQSIEILGQLLRDPDWTDLEVLSKIIKYSSSESVNYLAQNTAQVAT